MLFSDIKLTPIIESLRLQDISDEEYFSKKYSNYISNSRLGLINPDQDGNPEKFFITGFTNMSDSLIFGSRIHEQVLQPESFILSTIVDRPIGKTGYIADYLYDNKLYNPTDEELYKAAQKFEYFGNRLTMDKALTLRDKCLFYINNRLEYEKEYKSNKPVLTYIDSKSRERIYGCLNSINKNKLIQELLHPTGLINKPIVGNEKTILLDLKVEYPNHEPFILKLKSKLDNFSIDLDSNTITVNDLKTTGKPTQYFSESLNKYRYYREMGMYSYLLSLCANKFYNLKNPKIKSNFLVVYTQPSYYSEVVKMNKGMFMKGFNEFIKLVKLVAHYVASNPRYSFFASV